MLPITNFLSYHGANRQVRVTVAREQHAKTHTAGLPVYRFAVTVHLCGRHACRHRTGDNPGVRGDESTMFRLRRFAVFSDVADAVTLLVSHVVVHQLFPTQHTTARRSSYPTSPVVYRDRVTRPALLLLFLVALRLTLCYLPCSTHGRAEVAQG